MQIRNEPMEHLVVPHCPSTQEASQVTANYISGLESLASQRAFMRTLAANDCMTPGRKSSSVIADAARQGVGTTLRLSISVS